MKLIDVPQSTAGNADLDQALAILGAASTDEDQPAPPSRIGAEVRTETFWRWRMRMVERMAQLVEPQRSGVQGMYVFGSTKNASAGPGSDIDLLVHFRGDSIQLERLQSWLNGWSLCLDEINYMRTGYRAGGLLDVHIVTDDDIAKRTSYAAKIGAVTDPARPLKMTPNGST